MNDDTKPLESGSAAARESSTYSNVDRLIEMASSKKPAELTNPAAKDATDSADPVKDKSMWKILLQLRPFLPYLARLVPVLDVVVGPLQSAGLSHEVRESIAQSTARIQSIQRDLKSAVASAVEDQALQLKRLEEELTRLRDAADKQTRAQAQLAEDLSALSRLIRISALGLGLLLVALIVMTAIMLVHVTR